MKEIIVETLADYLQVIKDNKAVNDGHGLTTDFVFRGQPADFPLTPKLCRLQGRGDILQIERLLLQEFKRSNPLLVDHRPMDDWDYLTLGQHFGLPTRLLDWSNNALTALWFATANQENIIEKHAIIWVLMAESEDYDVDIEIVHPFEVTQTKIVRPRIIRQRINNQSGVFTVCSSKEIKECISLNETDSFSEKLLKVKICTDRLEEIRNDLNTLGVNAFSIYPELEGLCSFLQWRYFK